MAACGTPKKVVTSEAKTASKETSTNTNSEYNAFFEAEKARIKGDKAKARTLYRDFVKVYKNIKSQSLSQINIMYYLFKAI